MPGSGSPSLPSPPHSLSASTTQCYSRAGECERRAPRCVCGCAKPHAPYSTPPGPSSVSGNEKRLSLADKHRAQAARANVPRVCNNREHAKAAPCSAVLVRVQAYLPVCLRLCSAGKIQGTCPDIRSVMKFIGALGLPGLVAFHVGAKNVNASFVVQRWAS